MVLTREGNTSKRPTGDDLSFLCIVPPTRVQATAGEAGGRPPHARPGLAIHLPRTASPQSSMTASAASRHRHRCARPSPFSLTAAVREGQIRRSCKTLDEKDASGGQRNEHGRGHHRRDGHGRAPPPGRAWPQELLPESSVPTSTMAGPSGKIICNALAANDARPSELRRQGSESTCGGGFQASPASVVPSRPASPASVVASTAEISASAWASRPARWTIGARSRGRWSRGRPGTRPWRGGGEENQRPWSGRGDEDLAVMACSGEKGCEGRRFAKGRRCNEGRRAGCLLRWSSATVCMPARGGQRGTAGGSGLLRFFFHMGCFSISS
jgi:hypothetical protein